MNSIKCIYQIDNINSDLMKIMISNGVKSVKISKLEIGSRTIFESVFIGHESVIFFWFSYPCILKGASLFPVLIWYS